MNQRHVAVELYLQENIRESGLDTQCAFHRLWIRERDQSGFGEGVDRNNGGAAFLGFLQRAEHAGVVGTGVLTDNQDGFGLVKILKFHRTFSDAHALVEGHTTGFVTHVGAIGEVVGAVFADKQLV